MSDGDPAWGERIKRAEKRIRKTPREESLTIITDDCNVTEIVYGNNKHPSWIPKMGEVFPFSWVVSKNDCFVVVQSGLNHYIFEAAKVKVNE